MREIVMYLGTYIRLLVGVYPIILWTPSLLYYFIVALYLIRGLIEG